jgi:hypothetical protein
MIWNSPAEDEYPLVRNFAQQRRFAIIAAHDSILAARVKQTRDVNRHRRVAPFHENDLAYISTKNISFPKGLARKLIPKYIGPYKILVDYKNQSFKIELPPHLKQRGVRDVFHASLLRIHIPNDDRLFPGRLFTQLNAGNDSDPEWAVNKILSHAGSSHDAIFEVLWKARDITWLPHLQIEHLNALKEYLDLQGVDNIGVLPTGKGKPPHQDPQVFMGAVSLITPPQNYKMNLGACLMPLNSLSQLPIKTLPTHRFSHCFTMSSAAQPAQAPIEMDVINPVDGLLTPLASLDIPIPFAEVDQLSDDTPRALKRDEIDNFVLVAKPMSCDFQTTTAESLLFAGSIGNPVPRVKIPSVASSVLHGLDPVQLKAIVESTMLLLGDTIQVAVRDAVSALKPPGRDTEMVDAVRVSAVSAVASAPVSVFVPIAPLALNAPIALIPAPMNADDDGFRNVSYNFNLNSTYETIDHPNLRRTSYTIFKYEDPNR